MKTKKILATVLIIIGIGLLMDSFNVFDFGELIGNWWPLILIFFGVKLMIERKPFTMFPIILMIIGILLIVNNINILPIGFWDAFLPLIFILIGIWIIFGRFPVGKSNISADEHTINYSAVFSGLKQIVNSDDFRGGNITAYFGGADVDLRNVKVVNDDIEINLNVSFGGIELKVPVNWVLIINGSPFFGALENKTHPYNLSDEEMKTVKINYNISFGGIEIRN
jgi:predicted membrane protein